MKLGRTRHSVSRRLAAADELARAGRCDEAIASLHALNRERPDVDIETRLVDLRSVAFTRTAAPPVPYWPDSVSDLFPGAVIPEVSARDLTAEHVRSGIWNHGSVIVRGLIGEARVGQLVADIDAALAAYDADAVSSTGDAVRWYRPFTRDDMSDRARKRLRGSVMTVESPRSLFDLVETFNEARLTELLHAYFGEQPMMLARKCTLRRIEPNGRSGGWHQDGAFMGAGVRSINVWIALTHCGDDAPGLDIVGRRLTEIVQTGDGAFAAWATSPEAAERAAAGSIVRPIFEPGDALVFDHMNLHRTAIDPDMRNARYTPRDQLPILF